MRRVVFSSYQAVLDESVSQDLNVLTRDRSGSGQLRNGLGTKPIHTAQNSPPACGRDILAVRVFSQRAQAMKESWNLVDEAEQSRALTGSHDNYIVILTS